MSILVTFEGKSLDYLNPQATAINLNDILRSLPRMNRFVGHSSRAYNVGEHSLHCWKMSVLMGYTPREQLLVLIHDFTEAYVGDCPAPLKRLIPDYQHIEHKVERAICEHLGIKPPTNEETKKVKVIDLTMLMIEMKQLTVHRWEEFLTEDVREEFIDNPNFVLNVGNALSESVITYELRKTLEHLKNEILNT